MPKYIDRPLNNNRNFNKLGSNNISNNLNQPKLKEKVVQKKEDEQNYDYKKRNTEIIHSNKQIKQSNDNSDDSYNYQQKPKSNISNDRTKDILQNKYNPRIVNKNQYNDNDCNDYNDNDDDDGLEKHNSKIKAIKDHKNNNPYINKPKNLKNTNNPNIVQSISLLMEELTFSDLLVLKEQIDTKLFSMGNNKKASKNPNAYYSNEDD